MRRLGAATFLLLLAACNPGHGDRCNPLEYSNNGVSGNCPDTLECLYPTASSCGVAFCCKTDANHNIIDTHPNCQPDPSSAAACGLDFGVADAGGD